VASMISVPVRVGVELGSGVAVFVGAAVAEAVAGTVVGPSLGEGVSNIGEGIVQAAITSSPIMNAAIHGFRLRTGLILTGANLVCTFSLSTRSILLSFILVTRLI
jgi:hypothetical protein